MNDQALTAVRLPPSRRFLRAVDAAWARGEAVLPLDPRAPVPAVEAICTALGPSLVVDVEGEHRRPNGRGVPSGTALVAVTSGTTADPKGVVLSHEAVVASVSRSLDRVGGREGERWLCCLPTHHVAGLLVLLRSRALGTGAVVVDRFSTERIAAVLARGTVQHVSLVPTQLRRLLDADVDLSGLSTILLGGAAAPPGLLTRAQQLGLPVTTSYGMTETCGGCVYDGIPFDGVEVRIADDDRIHVRGPVLFDGYLGAPERTRQVVDDDGWLRTSDRGRLDDDGRLLVLGRADDVVVSGGENIPTQRVAALMEDMAQVEEAVVVGVPDPVWGERAVALVEASPAGPPGLREVRAHLRRLVPRAWIPQEVHVVDVLPRTALGKPDVRAARLLARELPRGR